MQLATVTRGPRPGHEPVFVAPIIPQDFAADFQSGEGGTIRAGAEMELLAFTLPMLSRKSMEQQLPSTEPLPGESVPETV